MPATPRAGRPAARHIAARRTECSEQSPSRVSATSEAVAKPTLKSLLVMYLVTDLRNRSACSAGLLAPSTALPASSLIFGFSASAKIDARRYSRRAAGGWSGGVIFLSDSQSIRLTVR